MFYLLTRRANTVITVSEFSKREIEKYYPAANGKIRVVPNAWQHMERVQADPTALERSGLEPGTYFFAMSSLAPNKNLKWIVETARLNPSETFAVAGGLNPKVFGEYDIPEAENVKYLGYVTDEEAKALMANCRCFLYPTFYEGFGIPPMEAMASGVPAVAVSDTEVMTEIYEDAVHYVNPNKPQDKLARILKASVSGYEMVLNRFVWSSSAQRLYKIAKNILTGSGFILKNYGDE